jgi:Holliday junction resolvase RusA-like endonuclease
VTPRIYFIVHGNAQPKGSARAFVPKGWKRPVVTSDNPNLKRWETTIRGELQRVMAETRQDIKAAIFEAPVRVSLAFYVARPKSLPKRVAHATKKPDLDKLVRGAIDSLSGVLIKDDSQVISILARKLYAQGAPYLEVIVEAYESPLFAEQASA